MSIRRKSCDPCYKSRRRCDLTFPACDRCQRNNKECHYLYPPQLPARDDAAEAALMQPAADAASSDLVSYFGEQAWHQYGGDSQPQLDQSLSLQLDALRRTGIPKSLGILGDMEPIVGRPATWTWVFNQLRDYPIAFAKQAETVFIHKTLYRSIFPRPLRAAFGICAACVSINDRNRAVLFQALDAEIAELLAPAPTSNLLEDLARLQAALLYQIIRLSYGGLEQRIVAEQQEFLVRSYGLTLLQRADAELASAQRTWETWIFAESIRRTVLIAFKLYTTYSNFRYGVCTQSDAMGMLPLSTKPGSWTCRFAYQQEPEREEVVTYTDYKKRLDESPPAPIEPFDELILLGCKGKQIEAPAGQQCVSV